MKSSDSQQQNNNPSDLKSIEPAHTSNHYMCLLCKLQPQEPSHTHLAPLYKSHPVSHGPPALTQDTVYDTVYPLCLWMIYVELCQEKETNKKNQSDKCSPII